MRNEKYLPILEVNKFRFFMSTPQADLCLPTSLSAVSASDVSWSIWGLIAAVAAKEHHLELGTI